MTVLSLRNLVLNIIRTFRCAILLNFFSDINTCMKYFERRFIYYLFYEIHSVTDTNYNTNMVTFYITYNTSYTIQLEQFSFKRQRVIGFALLRYNIGLKTSHHFFIQSEVKLKPIVTRSHTFSRALRQQHETTSSFDWFAVCIVCLLCNWLRGFTLVLRFSIN